MDEREETANAQTSNQRVERTERRNNQEIKDNQATKPLFVKITIFERKNFFPAVIVT